MGAWTVLWVMTATIHEVTAVAATHTASSGVLFGVKNQPVIARTPYIATNAMDLRSAEWRRRPVRGWGRGMAVVGGTSGKMHQGPLWLQLEGWLSPGS